MIRKVHLRDQRLFINAGIEHPKCRANADLLDLELRYEITSDLEKVTCKKCLNSFYGKAK